VDPAIEIFVRLLNEGVDVCRPVKAQEVGDSVFRILEQPYERNVERWEFEPADVVVCDLISGANGRFLAALRRQGA
jgi:hypothetical protein